MSKINSCPYHAGFWRRLAAMFYDSFILLAIYLLSTWIVVIFRHGHGVAPGSFWFQGYLLLVTMLFFLGFWLKGGQTLGMRAWRMRLLKMDGSPISFWQGIGRFFLAIPCLLLFGLGFWILLFNKEKKTLYDWLLGTQVVVY